MVGGDLWVVQGRESPRVSRHCSIFSLGFQTIRVVCQKNKVSCFRVYSSTFEYIGTYTAICFDIIRLYNITRIPTIYIPIAGLGFYYIDLSYIYVFCPRKIEFNVKLYTVYLWYGLCDRFSKQTIPPTPQKIISMYISIFILLI